MALARVQVPATAKRGEVIDVRIAIQHPMETGFRFDANGRAIPMNVVKEVVCFHNGVEVFRAELGSGVAANPYLQFHAVADASGTFAFEWVDDTGARDTQSAPISVG